jgi:hypothetical protein
MGFAEAPLPVPGSTAFDELLTQCRDLASTQLDAAIAGMLGKADEALTELATKTQDRETQKRYLEVKELARTKRAEFEKAFHQRFLAEFQQRTNKARKLGGSFSDADVSMLELVADDDLEETLKFNEMAAKLRRICEDELMALDQRVGVLVGDADLQAEANPLSPNAVCDAFKQACRQTIEGVPLRAVFLRLFDDLVADGIRSIYKALNDLLVQNAILPKIRYGAPRKEQAKKRKVKDKDGVEREVEEPPAEDMFAALQKLFAAAGGGGGGGGPGTGVGGGPLLQGAELLGSLTQLQLDGLAALGAGATLPEGAIPGGTNILHELKASSVGSSMGQMDAMTLDIVARLFDQLFDDPKIPLGAKGLIGRLQIPMLKVAIADKDLFSKKDHPARMLLDTLGEIAIRLPADFNTDSKLFGHLETILQELITGYKDDVEIFGIVRDQLTELMRREDERIEAEARAASERVVQEEALAVAKTAAQAAVSARVQAHPLPGPVLEFIIEQWLKLMMLIHVRRGPASEPWNRAIEVMDQLIWSVQPKESVEDRRKLANSVPVLLKSLTAGLQACGVEEEVREKFFTELMRFHTAILSAPPKGAAAPMPEAPKAPPAALDFARAVTIRNPFGEGQVQVQGLEGDPEETVMNAARHATDPDALRVGDWFEWKKAGAEEPLPVRLIFITPRKTRYIFCDRNQKEYIECTRNEVIRRLRAGEAVLMDEEPEVPFFERIMSSVLSTMRGGAAAAT